MSTEDFPEASFEAALLAAESAAAAATQPTPEPVEPVAASPAPAVVEPPPAPGAPAPVPQYLLDREAALEAREQATRDAETKARDAMNRLAALEAREQAIAKQAESFDADPVGFVRALRPDLTAAQAARYAERMYGHALGKEAPLELRLEQKIAEIDRNATQANERLSKQIEEQQRQTAEAHRTAQLNAYTTQLKGSVAEAKPTEHPILSRLASTNLDRFASELLQEAAQDCAKQYATNPDKEPVPPAVPELVKRAEARLKALVETYAPPTPAAPVPQTPPVIINNRTTATQEQRSTPDPDDDKTLRAQALKAAGLDHIPVW